MESTAFYRALSQVREHSSGARWTALLCSLGTAVFYLLLIVTLILFADLLVSQGRIPTYGELSPMKRAGLRESDGVASEAGYQAYVSGLLERRVGPAAAEFYSDHNDRPGQGYGVLSPAVRYADHWTGGLLGWAASWNAWAWPTDGAPNTAYLAGLAVIAVVLALGRSVCMVATNYSAANASLEAVTRLRRLIYVHTFRLGNVAIRKLGPSEAVSLFTRHVEAVHEALHAWMTSRYRYPLQVGLLVALAFALNLWLAAILILTALLVWFVGGQLAIQLRKRGDAAERRASNRLALLQESLMMMRLVKVYLMERFNQNRVERQLADYARLRQKRYRAEADSRAFLIFFGSLAVVFFMFIAGRVILAQAGGAANLAVQMAVLVSLYFPVKGWLDSRRALERGRASAAAVYEYLDRRDAVRQIVDAQFLPPMTDALEFREVSLREPGTGRMLLRDIKLRVKAGERVCVVGTDEGEKHALVYLVPRFLDPSTGEVRIDGKNLRAVTQDSLRSQVAIVLQHNLVFNDTVGNNIGCGDPGYGLPQVIEAAKTAHAHQFIQDLPHGYETTVGEMGHLLKTGEQFRLALARAALRNPAVLIVEEPTAPLDEDTKDLIDDTINRLLPGRTIITLPHRVSTLKKADRIFVLDEGKLAAHGTHSDLMQHNPLYKHLLYMEFGGFAAQAS